jgi:hypothetical protein
MQLTHISIKRADDIFPTVIITVNSDIGPARIELLGSAVDNNGLIATLTKYISTVHRNNRLSRQKLLFNMKAKIQDTSIMDATLAHLSR